MMRGATSQTMACARLGEMDRRRTHEELKVGRHGHLPAGCRTAAGSRVVVGEGERTCALAGAKMGWRRRRERGMRGARTRMTAGWTKVGERASMCVHTDTMVCVHSRARATALRLAGVLARLRRKVGEVACAHWQRRRRNERTMQTRRLVG